MNEIENQRAEARADWEAAAVGWSERAEQIQRWGMPVSAWLVDRLALQPGMRVLELAAGPGDTGFLAAEIVAPGGGVVICTDGAQAMVEVARRRAAEQNVRGVEFRQIELEWIDLPTADVDRILCRWGVMLAHDPAACLTECRRVLRPGGRIALAVWASAAENPWLTLPRRALAEAAPPAPEGPGPLSLSDPEELRELIEAAGFTELELGTVDLSRSAPSVRAYLEETATISNAFGSVWRELTEAEREQLHERASELAARYIAADGSLTLPGRSLVVAASA